MTSREGSWPEAWRARVRYLPWQARTRRNGGIGKVPLSPTGYPVDPLDRRAWQTWDAAWDAVDAGRADGVGLAITPGIRLTAIDLDHCVDEEGRVGEEVKTILDIFSEAYVEYSPSGTGVHLLVRAPCPPGWRRQEGIELIDRGFITVTGRGCSMDDRILPDHTETLATWHANAGPRGSSPLTQTRRVVAASHQDWFTRACEARNGERFRALWQGEFAGCPSASEADLQLLLIVLYWHPTATDDELIALWKQSGRGRKKLMNDRYVWTTVKAARQRNHQAGPVGMQQREPIVSFADGIICLSQTMRSTGRNGKWLV